MSIDSLTDMSGSTCVDEVATQQQEKMRSSPSYHVTLRIRHFTVTSLHVSLSSDGRFSVGLGLDPACKVCRARPGPSCPGTTMPCKHEVPSRTWVCTCPRV